MSTFLYINHLTRQWNHSVMRSYHGWKVDTKITGLMLSYDLSLWPDYCNAMKAGLPTYFCDEVIICGNVIEQTFSKQ